MDLVKQYIIQSVNTASNNLRLNSQQIQILALLREIIIKSKNLGDDFVKMKKTTEFSTLGIRLAEIHNFLTQETVDFLRVSEKFRDHSRFLIKDLNYILENISLDNFKKAKESFTKEKSKTDDEIKVNLAERKVSHEFLPKEIEDSLKEQIIFADDSSDDEFQKYEKIILEPIKSIDEFLKTLSEDQKDLSTINKYAKLIKKNGELSKNTGFEIIAKMHSVLSNSFLKIADGKLKPSADIIRSMRACLIVIVAVIKSKDVDITEYIQKANELELKIIK
jgi:hypothetical protein